MMINLHIPSGQVSTALQQALSDLGLHTVTHWEQSLHIDGTPEQIAEAQALVASFDLDAGVWADIDRHYSAVIEGVFQAEAKAHGYTSIDRACVYASYPNPYQTESQTYVAWIGATWDYYFAQLAAMQAGTRTRPTDAELIAELPART